MKLMRGNATRWNSVPFALLALGLFVVLAITLAAAEETEATPAAAPLSTAQHEEAAGAQHEESAAEQHGEEGQQAAHEGEDDHAAEGDHGAAASHGMPWSEVIYRWINFFLLAALMYWVIVIPPPFIQDIFSFPGLKAVFANRSEAILEAKALAEKQRSEAAEILTASATRLEKIEVEVGGLLDQARADGDRERQQAEESGSAQAEKIREMAGRELRAEATAAQRKLREHVAQLAVGMAEKLLKDNLSREDQQRLVEDYISRLGERVV
jgi:F-type H+-transporting ATPase subunit b